MGRASVPAGPNASAGDTQANTVAQTFAKELTVGPKQSVLIDLPVAAAPNLGLTFIAQPGVSVSLLNEQGVLVSRDPGDSPFANVMFRTVLTRRPVTDSVWKLKIENTTQRGAGIRRFQLVDGGPAGSADRCQVGKSEPGALATGFFAALFDKLPRSLERG